MGKGTARIAFVVTMLAWPTARAAESPRAVTLQEARNYAREHQPSVRAALARIAAAKADAAVPRAEWYPRLGAAAQLYVGTTNNTTALYLNTPEVEGPRIGGTSSVDASHATFKPYGSTYAGVGISQEVFDFGRIGAQASAADALVDVARNASDTASLDVDFAVEESFYAVLASKGVLDASEQAYERTRTHRDYAKANVDAKLMAPIELTRAEAQLARFDIARIHARGGVTSSQAVLAAAVGAPDLTLDASGALPAYQDVPTLQAAIEESASRDPRVREALAKVHAQEARTKAIFAEMRPDLSATGTFSMRAGGAPPSSGISADLNGWLPSVPNWDVGLVFTWPLYDATIVARGRASEARARALQEDVAALKQALTADVQRAYIAVQIARDALPGLERAATAAIANYEQADARFKAGLGTAIELADAEALRAQTEIDLAIGKFDLAKARAQLDRAIAHNLVKR
jgi:outer membrane protein TolC